MGDMLIRNIPEALKHQIEQAAAETRQSLSAQAIELLRKGLTVDVEQATKPKVSAWESLRAIYRPDGDRTSPEDDAEADAFAKIMDEIEAERKRDVGRPVPDLD